MWHELRGVSTIASGISGTFALPAGAFVLQIQANPGSNAATVQIFDNAAAVTLPANSGWWGIQFNHCNSKPTTPAGTRNIVFTSTASYVVEYVSPVGATN